MVKIAQVVYHIPVMARNSINCYLIEDVLIDANIRSSYNIINKAINAREICAHGLYIPKHRLFQACLNVEKYTKSPAVSTVGFLVRKTKGIVVL